MKSGALEAPDAVHSASGQTAVVDVLQGRERFLALKTAWNQTLVAGSDPAPALEHEFLRLWLESFAAGANTSTYIARQRGQLTAAIGLITGAGNVERVPVRIARAWTNAHSTRGGALLGDEGLEALGPLVARIADESWDVLELRDLPRAGGLVETLAKHLRSSGFRTHMDRSMESPYIPLPFEWAELNGRLDSRFRQNLRRRRRRLEEQGVVSFETVRSLDGLDEALEDAFAIEASGWKGRDGSAIRSQPETIGFYAGWARQLAQAGRLRLSFLCVNGKRIAFHFAHVTRGRYHLPKCGFDEGWRECSPGQLLMVDVLQQCIEEHVETFEFLGHMMTWKRDWTPLVRPHATLWAFRRNVPGTAAWAARAKVRPWAIKAWRRVRHARSGGRR